MPQTDIETDRATVLRVANPAPPTQIDSADTSRTTGSGRARRWVAPALAALVLAGVAATAVALAHSGARRTGQEGSSPTAVTADTVHGRWLLRKVVERGHTVAIPASLGAYLAFSTDGRLQGESGCNFFSGTVRYVSPHSLLANGGITLKGCLGDAARVVATKGTELTIFANRGPVHAAISHDRLVLTARGYRLEYERQ